MWVRIGEGFLNEENHIMGLKYASESTEYNEQQRTHCYRNVEIYSSNSY